MSKNKSMSTRSRAVGVLFNEGEYAMLIRKATELTLAEGRRVSVAELVRRTTLAAYPELREIAVTNES